MQETRVTRNGKKMLCSLWQKGNVLYCPEDDMIIIATSLKKGIIATVGKESFYTIGDEVSEMSFDNYVLFYGKIEVLDAKE